jgi:hypothetical protein
VREAFLGAMGKGAPQRANVPVIALSTTLEEGLPEKEGVISVPWPCETKVLVERIEAALLDVSAASAASTTQARTGLVPWEPSCACLYCWKPDALSRRNRSLQRTAPAARLQSGPLRPRRVGLALPPRYGDSPLQRPGRRGGGHRTGGEDALQGAKPLRLRSTATEGPAWPS